MAEIDPSWDGNACSVSDTTFPTKLIRRISRDLEGMISSTVTPTKKCLYAINQTRVALAVDVRTRGSIKANYDVDTEAPSN